MILLVEDWKTMECIEMQRLYRVRDQTYSKDIVTFSTVVKQQSVWKEQTVGIPILLVGRSQK